MSTRSRLDTRLTVTLGDTMLKAHLRIRLRVLLALLAASGLVASSPALLNILTRLAGLP